MPKTGLPYWKARAACNFLDKDIWTNREWRAMFPEVYECLDGLRHSPPPERGKVWIPYPMLVAMAKRARLFFATNGEKLMATIRRAEIPSSYEEISALEALERYGPEHFFEAGDSGLSHLK